MSTPQGWGDILDVGEEIIWQGRPDGKVVLRARNIVTLIFGLFVTGFALFWIVMAAASGSWFWMFGLIHLSGGVALLSKATVWSAFKRRRTWYTLTDRRAIIATDLPLVGKRLKSWPITPQTVLKLEQGPPDTVNFAEIYVRGKNGPIRFNIGFERIDDGPKIYRLLRDIQDNAQARLEIIKD